MAVVSLAVALIATPQNRSPHRQLLARAAPVPVTTTAVVVTTTSIAPPPALRTMSAVARSRRRHPSVTSEASGAPSVPLDASGCNAWGGGRSRAQSDACWGDYVRAYGDWNSDTALRIIFAESHGDAWARNSSNHIGLFQIHNSDTQGNGPANIAQAHAMWLRSGWAPWRASGNW